MSPKTDTIYSNSQGVPDDVPEDDMGGHISSPTTDLPSKPAFQYREGGSARRKFRSFDASEFSEMSSEEESDSPASRVPSRHPSTSPKRHSNGGAGAFPSDSISRPPKPSWRDLDLSIAVALVAPMANWLTGSDHLKNLFLILLIIVYLHQLIQGKFVFNGDLMG